MRSLTSSSGRHLALIVLVAALVVLAGCSGGGNGTADPSETTDAPAEEMETTDDGDGMETTDDGDGMETTDDGDGMETTATDDGTGETTTTEDDSSDGDLDGESIFGGNNDALQNAGSFTAKGTFNSTTANGETSADILVLIDVDAGEGYQQVNVSASGFTLSQTTYTRGDETFRRSGGVGGTQYQYETEPYGEDLQPVNLSTANTNATISGNTDIQWSEAGSATVNGVATTQYTASGAEDFGDPSAVVGSQISSVDTIELNAYVDNQGIVRRLTVDFAGESSNGEITQSITYDITDVGSTTVPTPDWLEEARNSGN